MFGTILARMLQAVDIVTLILLLLSKISERQLTFVLIGTLLIEVTYTIIHIRSNKE